MADARDVGVWTYHSEEHRLEKLHTVTEDIWLRRKLLEAVPNQTGAIVVDFGCGSGLWRNLFDGYSYTGLDQNAGMIDVAKSRSLKNATFQKIDWHDIPLPTGSVDLIFTSAVIQHNRHPDKQVVLREFNRVLKPGGYYLCTENTFRPDNYRVTFAADVPFHADLDDGYSFTSTGWERFMAPFGFQLMEYCTPSEYLYKKVGDVE